MNNIIFKKIEMEDEETISFNAYIKSDHVVVNQDLLDIYIEDFLSASQLIEEHFKENKEVIIKFTDVFYATQTDRLFFKIYHHNLRGYSKIKVDIQVDVSYCNEVDTNHRCCFFMEVETESLWNFGKSLKAFVSSNTLNQISLYEC